MCNAVTLVWGSLRLAPIMWNCPKQHTEEMGEVGRVKVHDRGCWGNPLIIWGTYSLCHTLHIMRISWGSLWQRTFWAGSELTEEGEVKCMQCYHSIPYSKKILQENTYVNWWKKDFCGENFHRLLASDTQDTMPRNFAFANSHNSPRLLPQKFPAITV